MVVFAALWPAGEALAGEGLSLVSARIIAPAVVQSTRDLDLSTPERVAIAGTPHGSYAVTLPRDPVRIPARTRNDIVVTITGSHERLAVLDQTGRATFTIEAATTTGEVLPSGLHEVTFAVTVEFQ